MELRGSDSTPAGNLCPGCAPCPDRHCVVCGVHHVTIANPCCGDCLDDTRDNLRAIEDLHTHKLLTEAVHRAYSGERPDTVLGGDAMVMLATPSRWREQTSDHLGHQQTDESDADPYPALLLLATWEDCWRDHLGHDPAHLATVPGARDYLDRNLSFMATEPTIDGHQAPPFADFAAEVRACVNRLRGLLHDSNRGDPANLGCFYCGDKLERRLTAKDGFEDHWTCKGCRRTYTYAEYNLALRLALETATEVCA